MRLIAYFNPRSHEGSDQLDLPSIPQHKNFNPRSHEGSDHLSVLSYCPIFEFQSTLPRGERRFVFSTSNLFFFNFNPRSHEGSDIRHCCHLLEYPHFNPRSHEGSDKQMIEESVVSYISIHAPTRGATFWNFPQKPFRGNFNPRSHEGSDTFIQQTEAVLFNFNPRSHEGSDKFKVLLQSCDQISIHAPTRGATRTASSVLCVRLNFNPRSHEGSDARRPLM